MFIQLGTHKIRNKNIIRASSALSGTAIASCCTITNYADVVTGCLAIITSSNRSELPVYKIIHLPSSHDPNTTYSPNVTIHGLSPHSNYRISLFETIGNFPVIFPAQTENFYLSNSQHTQQPIKQAPGMYDYRTTL